MLTLTNRFSNPAPAVLLTMLLGAPAAAASLGETRLPSLSAPAPVSHSMSVDAPVPRLHTLATRVSERQPSERPRRWVGERIDVSLRDADLVEVLLSFAKIGRFNLVLDPAVKGKVTVELRNVPWDAALVVILRTHGLAAEIDGRIVSVSPLFARANRKAVTLSFGG